MSKKTKCEIILDYMKSHNGKATIWEIQSPKVARTTSGHKFMQCLVQRGLVKSEKAENASYHIYSLVDKQLKLL